MEQIILIAIHGITVIVGVFVGYKLALAKVDFNQGNDFNENLDFEENEIPDSMVKKILTGEYFNFEREPKESAEDKAEKEKRHAFYD